MAAQFPRRVSLGIMMSRAILISLALSGIFGGGGAAGQRAPLSEASICVKYGPCPLDISSFTCTDTPRSSFIRSVCYDAPKSFMVIKLNETWYPYCEIDAATVQQLLSAESAGNFYNQNIRSRQDGTHGPFDCRDHLLSEYRR
jgi:hypothetical protein